MKFIELLSRNEKKIQEFGNFMRLQGVVKDTLLLPLNRNARLSGHVRKVGLNYSSFRKRLE